MDTRLNHPLDLRKGRDERARERFVSGLRGYVLMDLAGELRQDYETKQLPAHLSTGGAEPTSGSDVHNIVKNTPIFNFYSSLRCTAQELVWDSVMDSVGANRTELQATFETLSETPSGSLSLDPELDPPRYADAVDVHLMPSNYRGGADAVVEPGAVYDNGLNVFAFGAMGRQLNDIGWSMATFFKLKFPHLKPQHILDVGCTIGHNTLPWKQTFPDAEVTGVDLAAACLRYAHARAEAMDVAVHFKQASGDCLPFEDNSVDVVFTSMFLHELPVKMIHAFMAEAHRVLKPGGVLLNMELPPNSAVEPYDGFYLDWDCYYNNEPFYKPFRDQDYRELTTKGGFAPDRFFEAVMPRQTYVSEEEFTGSVTGTAEFDEDTGRLSDQIKWYGFGSVKADD
ncbi:MAG: class I SAM-dependent methyltransferase [Pseudomonadota bacterium]